MPTFGRPRRPLGPLVLLLLTLNAAYIIASAPAPSDQAWPWRRSGGRLAAHGRPGPRRTLASHRQAESVNITATHKGEWKRLAWPARLADVGLLQQAGGIAVLKLRNLGRPEGGVFNVEGEMVLRDGQYVSSGDTVFHLQGVHVPAAGRLMAVVEPTQPIRMPVEAQQPGNVRRARLAAAQLRHEPEGAVDDEGRAQGEVLQRDELLRAAARRVAAMASRGRADGGERGELPDATDAYEEARAWQACEFMLDLRVRPAPAAQRGSARRGGRAAAVRQSSAAVVDQGSGASALRHRAVRGRQRHALLDEAAEGEEGSGGGGRAVVDVVLNGTLVSRSCGIRLGLSLATAHVEEYYSKAVNYTLMITALGFLQVLLLVRQMEACATPALASRVSLLTLAHQAVLDAYLCLVHLTLGIMIESLFHSFGTVAFMQFVVFAIFEFRFLLSVWRARRGGVDPWTAQREVSVLYLRFYAALLGGILLTYKLQRHMPILMFAFFSYWWPQIVLCMRTDCRQPLKPEFVLGTSLARLALPLYVYACPSNLLRVQPNLALCMGLVAYVGLQCGLLLAQHRWGPRCFIPWQLLPRRYDYGRALPKGLAEGVAGEVEAGDSSGECVICMNQVDASDEADRAVTPCSHIFHRSCLERWLSYKQDCPTCRRMLPPL